MDPIALANEIGERYRRYLRTTFLIKDPELRRSFDQALEEGQIVKGPFPELASPYRAACSPKELFPELLPAPVDPAFLRAIEGDRPLYAHQEAALQRAIQGRNIIVATGTGSGKTECFLYPILLWLYREFERGTLMSQRGVRALILYPMNALAFDQRKRLRCLCQRLESEGAGFRFKFGQYVGATPEDAKDTKRHATEVIAHRLPGELVTRQEMRDSPPHILLTNFSMLEYLLIRPKDSPLFDGSLAQAWRFFVLDEAHQYRGTRGAEMALLLRRLKQRIRPGGGLERVQCIATSATLAAGEDDRAPVASFATALFAEPFDTEDVILAEREDMPEGQSDPLMATRHHLFLRNLEGAFARYFPKKSASLTPQGQSDGEGPAFEVALCRECGQHYFVGRNSGGQLVEAIRDPTRDDFEVSFFRPIEVENAEDEEDDKATPKRFELCAECGRIWGQGAPPACDHRRVLVVEEQPPSDERPDQIRRCSACGYRGPDPVREVIHSGDGPHAMIATTLFERIEEDPRKILAFADNRQEAAYFAWYLEETYQSILRRNLLYHSILETQARDEEPLSLTDLADAYRRRRAKQRLAGEAESRAEQNRQAWLEVYRELLTEERRLSLSGVGLIRWFIKWPGSLEPPKALVRPPWSLDRDHAFALTFLLLDSLRRDRAVELSTEEVELDWADLGFQGHQRRARLGPPHGQKDVVSWNGPKGWRFQYLKKLLERRGHRNGNLEEVCDETLRSVWAHLTSFADTQNGSERLLIRVGDGRRLNPVWYRLSLIDANAPIWRCDTCNRVESEMSGNVCPRSGCNGSLVPIRGAELSDNHYRLLYQGDLPGNLVAKEHTAQLATDRGQEVQREFQEGKIHVLSCSTTFELGVDLGDLNVVFLRNVPPESFNYVQRVGRAGRRPGSPGFAVTYCRRAPHDLYYFADPSRLINGRTKPPIFSLDNERVAERHLAAVLLAEYFRDEPERFRSVAHLIGDWSRPTLGSSVRDYLYAHREALAEKLCRIFPESIVAKFGGGDSWINLVAGSESRLARAELEVKSDFSRLEDLEQTAARERRYSQADWAKGRMHTIGDENVLSFLSRKSVIPKYGFPVDVVELDTSLIETKKAQDVSLTRDLGVAIGEFAPTASLIASKLEWQSYGVKRVPEKELDRKNYKVCPRHNVMVSWQQGESEKELPCGDSASKRTYIVPIFGFTASRNPPKKPTHKPARLFTTRPYFLGSVGSPPETLAFPDASQPVATLQKASPGRLAVLSEGRKGRGFYICGACGAGFVERAKAAKHKTPWGRDCGGTVATVSLAHEFVTDVVRIQFHLPPPPDSRGVAADATWLGFGVATALQEGLADEIQVPSSDLSAMIGGSDGVGLPTILLYDAVPGGAGLAGRIEDPKIFRASLEAAQRRVAGECGCGEDASCYGCLRSYRNQFAHVHLKRGLVRRYLDAVLERWRS